MSYLLFLMFGLGWFNPPLRRRLAHERLADGPLRIAELCRLSHRLPQIPGQLDPGLHRVLHQRCRGKNKMNCKEVNLDTDK